MARYYIMRDGAKLYKDTVKAIEREARKLADATGIGVPVYIESMGRSQRAGIQRREATFARNPVSRTKQYVASVKEALTAAGYAWSKPAYNMAVFNAEDGRVSVAGTVSLIKTYLDNDYFEGSPYKGAAANKRFKRNPAARPYFMIYVRDNGEWSPQFGDYTRADVVQEVEDSYKRQRGMGYVGDGKYAASDIKIVKFPSVPNNSEAVALGRTL